MTLQDIYNQLSYGELRLLFVGGSDIDSTDTGMTTEQFIKLLPTIQLGLTALYKQFLLREGQFFIQRQENMQSYVLNRKFAQSNTSSSEQVKYIIDTDIPFDSELFKVERVYGLLNEQPYEIPLNEINNKSALRTPSNQLLMLPALPDEAPWLAETDVMKVYYRTDHPKIDVNIANAVPLAQEIELPVTHLEALCFYVASRIHNPMGMVPGAMHEGNNYYERYRQEVGLLKQLNLEIDTFAEISKLHDRGFV